MAQEWIYIECPDHACHLTVFCAITRALQVRPRGRPARPHGAAVQTPLLDRLGNSVWRLSQPRIIRRPIPYPTNPNQGFYYNLLLDHVAFRSERELMPENSNYFAECVRRGIFTSTPQLNEHLLAYAKYNLYSETTLEKLQGKVTATCHATAMHALGMQDPEDAAQYGPDTIQAGAAALLEQQLAAGDGFDGPIADPGESSHPNSCITVPCCVRLR